MKSKPQRVMQELFRLSSRSMTTVPKVFICGRPGSGKTTLARSLAVKMTQLGAVNVRLDYWATRPSAERMVLLDKARKEGDETAIAFHEDQAKIYNWWNAAADMEILEHEGSLTLTNIYDQEMQTMTARADLEVSLGPPHLFVIDGSSLLHVTNDPALRRDKVRNEDGYRYVTIPHDYILGLDIDEETADSRRKNRDGHNFSEEDFTRRSRMFCQWWEGYLSRYRHNADIWLNERELNALHDLIDKIVRRRPMKSVTLYPGRVVKNHPCIGHVNSAVFFG